MDSQLQSLLDEMREQHGVIGASLGILKDGVIEACGSGLLNSRTQVSCTRDSVFQIGSITKVFTATLIMQLVEEGKLDLDAPVAKYLTDFALADPPAARSVTVRQLLNHTCGMDGDFFPADDPEGPSARSYVRKLCLLPSLYAPGCGPVTYSNSGYVVAGRIVEILTGRIWQDAVIESICAPLGMQDAFAHPREALRFRCAMGHVASPANSNEMIAAAEPYLPLSMAAAGTALTMSVENLLLFAKAHMAAGSGDGARILSGDSARRMREERLPVPPFSRRGVTHWGLGWFLGEGKEYRMAGHDGATAGQLAYLRTFPDRHVAFALLTNSPSDKMFRQMEAHLMSSLLESSVIGDPLREVFTVRPERYIGAYRNVGSRYTVTNERGALRLHFTASTGPVREFQATLEPYCRDTFEIKGSKTVFEEQKLVFLSEQDSDEISYLRAGLRMSIKEGTAGRTNAAGTFEDGR